MVEMSLDKRSWIILIVLSIVYFITAGILTNLSVFGMPLFVTQLEFDATLKNPMFIVIAIAGIYLFINYKKWR